MTKVPAKAACCSDSGNPVCLVREEYCVYIDDNYFGIYNKNEHKTSMPFGMSIDKVFGDSGSIRVKVAKSLFNNTPAVRYTISSFDPDASNPDSLWQSGSSAVDVFPGTPATFGGEINGYGQISGAGVLSVTEYTIYYVYDGINPIIEYSPDGSVLVRYIYAGGMHIAKIAGGDSSYCLTDALGSIRKMVNEDMGNAWTGNYFPFGELTISSSYPTPRDNTHGFTGKELDAEMGLNYFCQRYYDPQIGRFITLDPVDQKGASPYAYCANNPLKRIDPLGNDWDDFQGALYREFIPWDFSEEQWSWIEQNMSRIDKSERMAQRAGMFFSKSWQLDPSYPSVLNTPDQEIIPLGNGEYKCWDPINREWNTLRPGSLGEMIGDLWGFVTYTSTMPFTYLGLGLGLLSFDLPTIKDDVAIFESKKGFAGLLGKLGFGGITVGRSIIGVGQMDAGTLAHEMTHVGQFDRFGALFPLFYGGAGAINLGCHFWTAPYPRTTESYFIYWFYYSNPFEIEAGP